MGEALVSTLDRKGVPSVVARTLIRPPASRLGPATDAERRKIMSASPVSGQYDDAVDRESAYEKLEERENEHAEAAARQAEQEEKEKQSSRRKRSSRGRSLGGEIAESGLKLVTRELTRYLLRGVLGSLRR